MRSRSLVFGRNSSRLCCPSVEWVYLANWQDAEIDWSIWISRVDGWPPPPCPGGSPAGEELAIVTFSPGVCEKEWRTHFCSVIGWSKERESASLSPLFLSSSVVERSAVNWLVVGSNPTWGDLIHSELKNSEWKGSLWLLRVGNPFPVSLFLLHSISSYHILLCDIWESPSIPRRRSGIIHSLGLFTTYSIKNS